VELPLRWSFRCGGASIVAERSLRRSLAAEAMGGCYAACGLAARALARGTHRYLNMTFIKELHREKLKSTA